MLNAILGSKLDQSQMFDKDGNRITVTNILAGPCKIVAIKDSQKDGYTAVQVGFGTRRPITITKPVKGVIDKAGLGQKPPRFLREIAIMESDIGDLKPGSEIKVTDVFQPGDKVQVTSISKGKGFAGVVKRHGFAGGPRTHGQSDRERAPGSIGQTTTPGRVYKGKRMAGRMGQDRVTIKNLQVMKVDSDKGLMTISGLVAGGRNALLIVRKIS